MGRTLKAQLERDGCPDIHAAALEVFVSRRDGNLQVTIDSNRGVGKSYGPLFNRLDKVAAADRGFKRDFGETGRTYIATDVTALVLSQRGR